MKIKNLVIVESPAKGKTIEKYLGSDFTVKASIGHIRDLKKKGMGINLENFEPDYEVPAEKKKVVTELKKYAKEAEKVWIATDEDREWEAIGWHLTEALGLDAQKTARIVFHEITKNAITEAIKTPRIIDANLVNAQRARRLLDRIVGFEVSPILWRKVPHEKSLSAGRVQSVAVRLIVDREKEIEAFQAKESWKIQAQGLHGNTTFGLELVEFEDKKVKLVDEASARKILEKYTAQLESGEQPKGGKLLKNKVDINLILTDIEKKSNKRTPPAPFTTSTLQQEASRKLGFSVKQTMAVAQSLYQNGHISYMRTDSVNLSQEAISRSLEFIEQNYGKEYLVPGGRRYTTKSSGAQEAHEAIRPTDISKTPEKANFDDNDGRLYELIWKRTVASQMQDAQGESTIYTLRTQKQTDAWEARGYVITFDGFMKLYLEGQDDESEVLEEGKLPRMQQGEQAQMQEILGLQSFTRAPARYTEATLVKKLEIEGIGRPSTYAPTISTIIERGYIERQKKYLVPTSLARVVTEYLEANFAELMDYKFTAKVEEEFDQIAEGKTPWKDMLHGFYNNFHHHVVEAGESKRMTGERLLGVDPTSKEPIVARIGRFGPMVQKWVAEDDKKPTFASVPRGMNIETITLEEALTLFALPRKLDLHEGQEVKANIGRFGPYVQIEKTYASIPPIGNSGQELNVFNISFAEALELITAKKIGSAALKEFDNGAQILRGKYGVYMKYDGKNYKLTPAQRDKAADLTIEEIHEIIDTQVPTGKGKSRTFAKKKKK